MLHPGLSNDSRGQNLESHRLELPILQVDKPGQIWTATLKIEVRER
jgi:hypothetical protein